MPRHSKVPHALHKLPVNSTNWGLGLAPAKIAPIKESWELPTALTDFLPMGKIEA